MPLVTRDAMIYACRHDVTICIDAFSLIYDYAAARRYYRLHSSRLQRASSRRANWLPPPSMPFRSEGCFGFHEGRQFRSAFSSQRIRRCFGLAYIVSRI